MVEIEGSIVTVDGPINPDQLGVTLMHEHLFADWMLDKYVPPDSAFERQVAEEPLTLENQWYVRRQPFDHRENLRLGSVEDAVEEVTHFLRAGGDAIVDVTPKNVAGDPEQVRGVARETGVKVIHGTAFYTHSSHPERLENMSVEEVTAEFVEDVQHGIDGTEIRAGIIGEIGVSDTSSREEPGIDGEIHAAEERVLRAGARAAVRTGAPVSVHPPFQRTAEWPTSRRCLELLDILEEEGLEPERVVFCHRDQSKWLESDLKYQKQLADRGAYVEFDLFGHPEVARPTQNDAQPSDMDRVAWLMELIEEGYANRLLLSHDVFIKSVLRKYGGEGYVHILKNILPVLSKFGVEETTLQTLMIENPRRVLTFAEEK